MSLHLQCLPLLLNPVLMAFLQGAEVEQGILLKMHGLLCPDALLRNAATQDQNHLETQKHGSSSS